MSGRKIGCGLNTTRVLPRRDVGATRVEGFGFMRALCSVTRRPRHHRSRRGPWEHAYPSYVELLRAYNTEFVNRPKKSGNTGKTA